MKKVGVRSAPNWIYDFQFNLISDRDEGEGVRRKLLLIITQTDLDFRIVSKTAVHLAKLKLQLSCAIWMSKKGCGGVVKSSGHKSYQSA